MSDLNVRRWTGGFGVAAGVLILVVLALYVAAGSAPRVEDAAKLSQFVTKNNGLILTISLADTMNAAFFIAFVAGFRHLLRQARSDYEWVATLVFGVGLVYATLTLIFDTLIGGAALDTVTKAEPVAVRALIEGSTLVVSSVGLVVVALFLAAAAFAVLGTGALPRWVGWAGYIGAILNLVAVPTIYGGTDPTGFYTADGYAPLILGTLPYVIWLLIAGISLLVGKSRAFRAAMPG